MPSILKLINMFQIYWLRAGALTLTTELCLVVQAQLRILYRRQVRRKKPCEFVAANSVQVSREKLGSCFRRLLALPADLYVKPADSDLSGCAYSKQTRPNVIVR